MRHSIAISPDGLSSDASCSAAADARAPALRRASPQTGRTILSGVLSCVLLIGCATDTFHQTIEGGAVLGAGLGAGIAAIACAVAKGPNPALCAAGGLAVGAAAGSLTGYLVATKQ